MIQEVDVLKETSAADTMRDASRGTFRISLENVFSLARQLSDSHPYFVEKHDDRDMPSQLDEPYNT